VEDRIATVARRRRRGRLRIALAMAALVAAAAWLGQGGLDDLRSDHVTAVGEQDSIVLADGSTALLNTDTALAVDVDGDERRVRLFRGEALFQIARDAARPFIVGTGESEVRVTGTAFNVRTTGAGTVVSVTEGRVEVAAAADAARPVRLRQGQQIVIGPAGPGPVTGFDAMAVTAWQRGQVVFYRTPLGQVVEELNRYQYGRILVLSDHARGLKVSGVFDVRHPAEVIGVIEATLDLEVTRLGDHLILLR
jgi:transmembrane sensor